MSGVDERVETVRAALQPVWPHLGHGVNDLGPCPVCSRSDAALAALSDLAAAVADAEQRAEEAVEQNAAWRKEAESQQDIRLAAEQRADDAEKALRELREAARPFGEMAQEMLTGHPTGRIAPGAPQRLLRVLAAAVVSAEPTAEGAET